MTEKQDNPVLDRVIENLSQLDPVEIRRRYAQFFERVALLQEDYAALELIAPQGEDSHLLTLLGSLNRQFRDVVESLDREGLLP